MRISDWSSDVCSSDLGSELMLLKFKQDSDKSSVKTQIVDKALFTEPWGIGVRKGEKELLTEVNKTMAQMEASGKAQTIFRSEERTSELQSLMRNSYAVFCLKQKNKKKNTQDNNSERTS